MTTMTNTRAAELPQTDRDTGGDLSAAESQALLAMFEGVADEQWALPTDCVAWSVRDLLAHLAGAAEEDVRLRVTLRHSRIAAREMRSNPDGPPQVDYWTASQLAEREGHTPAELLDELRSLGPRAVRARRRAPRAMKAIRLPASAGLRPGATLGYMMDVIRPRDIWMHRIDLHRATGVDLLSTDAEAEVVSQVVRDLDLEWTGPAFGLTLTGRGEGSWQVGAGTPAAEVTGDAVAVMRLLSGRSDETDLRIDGNHAVGDVVRAARVVF